MISIDAATLIMRATLGVGFVAHGGQKLFGWFGGTGITGTTAFFAHVGLPAPHAFAYVSGILEFFGGIGAPRSSRWRTWPGQFDL
jgi:putative oxidoreductase